MALIAKVCDDLKSIKQVKLPVKYECAECIELGDDWVHLRTCQQCGVTLCCDSSKNQHASKHSAKKNHHIIASGEPGEKWLYCYKHRLFSKY